MRSFVASIITTAIALMAAMPAIAQPKSNLVTAKLVCHRMTEARRIISAESKGGEWLGYRMAIRSLKDVKKIPLSARKLAPVCLPGTDWSVSFEDDGAVQRALRFRIEEAIKAGVGVTPLLTPAELAASKK